MSTRPRIEFDDKGWCNACQWMHEKSIMDWSYRSQELVTLLDKHRSNNANFDCICPVSGGKDGSYVAYQLKHKYGMNPLTLTVTPPLSLEIGDKNLKSFIHSGYDHIQVNANPDVMRQIDRMGFITKGYPYFGWISAMQAAVVNLSTRLNIPLIFYGEDGEIEYGGSTTSKNKSGYSVQHMKDVFLEGSFHSIINNTNLTDKDLNFWRFPENQDIEKVGTHICHWSYFEAWDPYRNYLIAKEYCGLTESTEANSGTFTNFSQNDQALFALHTYLMYLKFGFGRATQDAGIEIRRGSMDRDQAKNLVQLYDNQYPQQFMPLYLEYYNMTQQEFDMVIDKHVNKKLFKKDQGRWQPTFSIDQYQEELEVEN